eukprot:1631344-Amphidinium_carterae.2
MVLTTSLANHTYGVAAATGSWCRRQQRSDSDPAQCYWFASEMSRLGMTVMGRPSAHLAKNYSWHVTTMPCLPAHIDADTKTALELPAADDWPIK